MYVCGYDTDEVHVCKCLVHESTSNMTNKSISSDHTG